MSEVSLLITIIERPKLTDVVNIYEENGIAVSFITLGAGTSRRDMPSYLGLSSREKAVLFSLITDSTWIHLKNALVRKLYFGTPGTGVAFILPLSAIGGKRELAFLLQEQEFTKGEESSLKDTLNELLVVISNQGYNDLVMDAARSAGAHGGSVLNAKGTGMKKAEKFLGVSLATEKDITFIVTRSEMKKKLMQAIMEQVGLGTPAKSIVFSLPVTDTAGLRLLDDEELRKMAEAASGTEEKQ